ANALCRALAGSDDSGGRAFDWHNRIVFRRGFIESLDIDFHSARHLIDSGHEPEPIGDFSIIRRSGDVVHALTDVSEIVTWRFGSCVTGFRLAGATDEDVLALLAGGQLTRLTNLVFWLGSVGDAATVALACSPLLASVKRLDLMNNK